MYNNIFLSGVSQQSTTKFTRAKRCSRFGFEGRRVSADATNWHIRTAAQILLTPTRVHNPALWQLFSHPSLSLPSSSFASDMNVFVFPQSLGSHTYHPFVAALPRLDSRACSDSLSILSLQSLHAWVSLPSHPPISTSAPRISTPASYWRSSSALAWGRFSLA